MGIGNSFEKIVNDKQKSAAAMLLAEEEAFRWRLGRKEVVIEKTQPMQPAPAVKEMTLAEVEKLVGQKVRIVEWK